MRTSKKTMHRSALLAATVGLLTAAAPLAVAPSASAHGWITSPPSRQDFCADGTAGFDCGEIKYEPQSVEAPKGSMKCSGGSRFTSLDEDRDWPYTGVDSTVTFRWSIEARHATSTWEYFVDGTLHTTVNDHGAQPGSVVEHTVTDLPQGRHTILARWNVADTDNAFYACVDVNVGGPSGGGGGSTAPDDCEAVAWSPSSVYDSGDEVTHDGHAFRARWWTVGEEPDPADEWGAWADLGPC